MSVERFIKAQNTEYSGYEQALSEIKAGQKQSHWIWFIFPQLKGLGHSYYAEEYGINGIEEAREYLSNDVLRSRLIEISQELLKHDGSIEHIMGSGIDAVKLRSSMTLFMQTDSSIKVFSQVLDKFFDGKADKRTITMLGLRDDLC